MAEATDIVAIQFDPATWALSLHVHGGLLAGLVLLGAAVIAYRQFGSRGVAEDLEIAGADFGTSIGRVSLKPNTVDRQVAYALWVELATRKVGLEIDLKDDVVKEIYDSWYAFFGVTRDLIKTIPVTKVSNDSTRLIVLMAVATLNEGVRPHLTRWQARFRHWYDLELSRNPAAGADDPEVLQARFPEFRELAADLLKVNRHLIAYRKKMGEIVYGKLGEPVVKAR